MAKNPKWSNEEIQILKDNYPLLGYKKITKLLPGRNSDSIRVKASQLKIKLIGKFSNWSDEEIQIIKDNYATLGLSKIKELLPGRTRRSILRQSSILNIKQIDRNFHARKYEVDSNFFKNLTFKSAYILGWFVTDGYLKKNSNMIRLKLASKDVEVLKNIKKIMGLKNPILTSKCNDYKAKEISFSSKEIYEDLVNIYKIIPNKTGNEYFPKEMKFLYKIAMIIGIIEGDGTIVFSKSLNQFTIGVVCSNRKFLIDIKNVIDKIIPENRNIKCISKIVKESGNPIYNLRICGKKALKLGQYLINFANSFKIPLLKRKWDEVLEYADYLKRKQINSEKKT